MKVRLLDKEASFNWQLVRRAVEEREIVKRGWRRRNETYFDTYTGLPWNALDLSSDLALDTIFTAMAGDDDCIYEASKRLILSSTSSDLTTIEYRQGVLQDCLDHPSVVQELYDLAVNALDKKRKHYISDYTQSHPDAMLQESIAILEELHESLKELNRLANIHAGQFSAEGWTAFFVMLQHDLSGDYLAEVERHLAQLRLRHEVLLLSAKLGEANTGTQYLLHEAPQRQKSLWTRSKALFSHKAPVYSFQLHPRDDAGVQALHHLEERGISLVASAVGQSADNVSDFFDMLQIELAFYMGCLNLRKKLTQKGIPICMPTAIAGPGSTLSFRGLDDISLALSITNRIVANDIKADGKDLIIITGTNSGGKSTFLRSLGIAQLMMQSGMFVTAKTFSATTCEGLLTHYKREEDTQMKSGKFDEELSRMSDIVDHLKPGAMILFNESFAATNEREGSGIAHQIITALLAKKIRVIYVTHLYELAHSFYERSTNQMLFLQAGRKSNGDHTFKMIAGKPSPTSHGEDLYKSIFVNSQHRATAGLNKEEA